ncbi:MAG: hypothetical protein PHW53_00650 [Patescibacteria group bacterium]|nr:hypothetical protein [Patescibacteria group bacterium]
MRCKMARKKSEFLSGLGTGYEMLKKLIDAVLAKGGGDEDLRRILNEPELVESMASLIVRKTVAAVADSFSVTVDYSKSLAEMIAVGDYDFVNSDITAEHFPISGKGKVLRKLVLVHLGREATTDEALVEMKLRGLKPADIEGILAFGAAYPDEQRKFPIVGLGSSWVSADGYRRFPYLGGSDGGRELDLDWGWGGIRWYGPCRFLAFCE